jgi:hypothetical protein
MVGRVSFFDHVIVEFSAYLLQFALTPTPPFTLVTTPLQESLWGHEKML